MAQASPASNAAIRLQLRVRVALEQLGASPDEVARQLVACEALGVVNSPTSCPVSVFVARELGIDGLAVATLNNHVQLGEAFASVTVGLPTPVAQFVREFDGGFHPQVCQLAAEDPDDPDWDINDSTEGASVRL